MGYSQEPSGVLLFFQSQVRLKGLLDKTRMLNILQIGEWVSLLNTSILTSLWANELWGQTFHYLELSLGHCLCEQLLYVCTWCFCRVPFWNWKQNMSAFCRKRQVKCQSALSNTQMFFDSFLELACKVICLIHGQRAFSISLIFSQGMNELLPQFLRPL